MALFYAEFLALACSNMQAEKQWWIRVFGAEEQKLPDWDDPRPSDVALQLPGSEEPNILLRVRDEVKPGAWVSEHPLIFCTNLKKARQDLGDQNVAVGPLHDGGGKQYFEICDPEGNVVEICEA